MPTWAWTHGNSAQIENLEQLFPDTTHPASLQGTRTGQSSSFSYLGLPATPNSFHIPIPTVYGQSFFSFLVHPYVSRAMLLCRTDGARVTKVHLWSAGKEVASADANLSGDHSFALDQFNTWPVQTEARWSVLEGLGLSFDVMFDSPDTAVGTIWFVGAGVQIDYKLILIQVLGGMFGRPAP